ncbi:MAG TPA: TetR family transcriptional regulator [Rhodobacterales bacterium]|nr:TetR family transcriptional regulator [Rhodobacterales bacterium]
MAEVRPRTRIQEKNRRAILDAALDSFSQHGFRGATLDEIARKAGLSKPNVLYYFASKEAIHAELIEETAQVWFQPLHDIDPQGDPIEEVLAYVCRKLQMSKTNPRESRLFANEIIQGAPRLGNRLTDFFKALVDEKAEVLRGWAKAGKIAPLDPYHLIFSIWATTQHYADFDVQVRGILLPEGDEHFKDAEKFLMALYRKALTPLPGES